MNLKKLYHRFRLSSQQIPEEFQSIRYKYDFLNRIYFIVCCASLIMGLVRFYESTLLGLITLSYSVTGFYFLYYLKHHLEHIEQVCTFVLVQSYIMAITLYLLNFPYTLRLSFFFLLMSTALFLKGRKQGLFWMMAIMSAIFIGDVFFINLIGYSHLDVLVSSFAIICLYFIVNSYEQVKEQQTEDLRTLNLELERKVQERTDELRRANQLLEQEKLTLKKLSVTDQLTGLYNRYKVKELFEYEKKQINRYNTDLSVIIIDIDFFKSINDSFGHIVGDLILLELANLLRKSSRSSDIVSRWGGEEFLIVTPKTSLEQAAILAEHIRQVIKLHQFSHGIHITVSFGVTSFQKNDTLESIILRADDALYKAKNSGRDIVKIHSESECGGS
ncbi:sensor histidine kinase [Legionella moravica]|uniref:diguanylate cyclase n=1 Tax=Legionella moravica TaxID=39962 RepID=A0A378K2Y1_9GAMM|nr:GGDEF domain-containing protein [Legionella moravica]KTD31031.1 sensor histidine kinase [Legionella moravica]STX63609.1 sensor histidine kinase [Legionella moravica]